VTGLARFKCITNTKRVLGSLQYRTSLPLTSPSSIAPMISRRLYPPLIISLLRCILLLRPSPPAHCAGDSAAGSGGGAYGGRHSYSLSTFSPSGGIDQVVRATRASMLGAPVVAMSVPPSSARVTGEDDAAPLSADDDGGGERPSSVPPPPPPPPSTTTATAAGSSGSCRAIPPGGGIYISTPLRHLASSPLIVDDGTPRVVRLTSSIVAVHAGVGADGRALCDYAFSLASDHEYVYGEEISPEELLEGLAGRVQEMTMRAGSRPYGCALLVGCLGDDDDGGGGGREGAGGAGAAAGPTMYRIDPSGAVVLLNPPDGGDAELDADACGGGAPTGGAGGRRRGSSVAFLGNSDTPHRRKIDATRRQLEDRLYATEGEVQNALIDVVKQTFAVDGSSTTCDDGNPLESTGCIGRTKRPMLYASFTRERGLRVSRIMGE
jgi:hypothetical protein